MNSFYIVLNSDDAAAVGSNSDYTTTLANTINLNDNYTYECCVVNGAYETCTPYTNKQVYFYCDLVEFSYNGGSLEQIVNKTNFHQPTVLEKPIVHFENQVKTWFKMSKKHFNTIRIQVKDENATPIPSGYSSVMLEIRQIQ